MSGEKEKGVTKKKYLGEMILDSQDLPALAEKMDILYRFL
jgi:hypothetical protein